MNHLNIENSKTAFIQINHSSEEFGLFKSGRNTYLFGFKNNPLYMIEQSFENERFYIDIIADGLRIKKEYLIFDNEITSWLSDCCCTDYSILNYLPSGKYRLVKTKRKLQQTDKILLGNEWITPEKNISCFTDSENNEIFPLNNTKNKTGNGYYSIITGSDINSPPSISQPLLPVIIPEYGIVWESATGILFFSFTEDDKNLYPEKDILLIIPYNMKFLINIFDNKMISPNDLQYQLDSFIKMI